MDHKRKGTGRPTQQETGFADKLLITRCVSHAEMVKGSQEKCEGSKLIVR